MRRFGRVLGMAAVGVAWASAASAGVTGSGGLTASVYLAAPVPGSDPLVSFDWGSDGALYYSTGDGFWGKKLNVYRWDGSATTALFSSSSVYAGAWVTANGGYVYFNEDSTYRLYRYDVAAGGAPVEALQQTNLWGVFFHNNALFATGSDASWNSAVFHSPVAGDGSLTSVPTTQLGQMGDPAGPLAFDAAGNLYYAAGYSSGRILKYSAAEVAAALADPLGSGLADPAGHVWADFASLGLAGASGLVVTPEGDVVASLTAWDAPSKLVRFVAGDDGAFERMIELASSPLRMTAVRWHEGHLYVADGDGVYHVPEPASLMLLAAMGAGLIARRRNV